MRVVSSRHFTLLFGELLLQNMVGFGVCFHQGDYFLYSCLSCLYLLLLLIYLGVFLMFNLFSKNVSLPFSAFQNLLQCAQLAFTLVI